jgi:hypothetical protein
MVSKPGVYRVISALHDKMSESVAPTVTSNSSTIQTTASTGRGGGRGVIIQGQSNQGSRNRNRSNNRSRNNNSGNTVFQNRSTFKGNTPGMNGYVFECYEECGDRTQYQKSLEALGEYTAKNMKYQEDMKTIFEETMTAPALTMPADNYSLRRKVTKSYGRRASSHMREEPRNLRASSLHCMP